MDAQNRLVGQFNYFVGNDGDRWHTGIPTFADVYARNIYPGIDIRYYGNQQQLTYDFLVAAGAEPDAIRLRYEGVERIKLGANGDLVLHVAGTQIRQSRPQIYQEQNGSQRRVNGRYLLHSDGEVSFQIAEYDRSQPLIIDPVLAYATFLGAAGDDEVNAIAVEGDGNIYGERAHVIASDAPTTPAAFQTIFVGGTVENETGSSAEDAFVVKIDLRTDSEGILYLPLVNKSNR